MTNHYICDIIEVYIRGAYLSHHFITKYIGGVVLYLQANLPEDYGAFKAIQRQNFPFNKSFEHFISTLNELQDVLGYDTYDTIGFVEANLLSAGQIRHKDDTKTCVKFRFKATEPAVVAFYQKSPLMNKHTTILICRLVISLSEVYSPSLNNMSYLVRKLQSEIQNPNLQYVAQQVALPVQPVVQPVQSQPVRMTQPQSVSNTQSQSVSAVQSTEESESYQASESEAVPQIQTSKKLPEQRPVRKQNKKAVKSKPDDVAPFANTAPVEKTSTDVDKLSKRASKLMNKIEETKAKPGTNITTNPLLADFL